MVLCHPPNHLSDGGEQQALSGLGTLAQTRSAEDLD